MRKFERDFKLSIVRRIAVGQLRKAQACREYSLSPSVLDRWCAQYERKGEEAFKNGGGSPMESAEDIMNLLSRIYDKPVTPNDLVTIVQFSKVME